MRIFRLMFSITRFLFEDLGRGLSEGGNTRALVRDPVTGKLTGPPGGTVKTFRGREAYAEEIDLKSGRIKRQDLRAEVIKAMRALDSEFKKDHGIGLWDPETRDEILGTGFAFNGSSAHLFAPPETLSDEEFIKFKPKVGDIDLTVPSDRMQELFNTLTRLEDVPLTDRITYLGHNRSSPGVEIYALFAYTWDPSAPEGQGDTMFQVDFEASEYEGGRPTEWSKFSHSSPWRDIEVGVKGLAHKILLFSLASAKNPPPLNAYEATPTATAEDPKIRMTKDPEFIPPSPEEIAARIERRADEILATMKKKDTAKAADKARAEIESEIKRSSMIPVRPRSLMSIDLSVGYGPRYKKLDWKYNGEEVYRHLGRSSREDATRDLKEIFSGLFGQSPPPSTEDLKNMESFLGVLKLMEDRLAPLEIVKVYEKMVGRLYGSHAQRLSVTSAREDEGIKDRILDAFRRILPVVESSTIDIPGLKKEFYSKYKVRGQEGYVEDVPSSSGFNESRSRSIEIIRS